MDLKSSNHLLHSNSLEEKSSTSNLFEDGFGDALSKLKLKETTSTSASASTDFVKLFPMAKTNVVVEAPPTPGRPIFSFSVGSRKNIPSKWDDAQKWLISGSESPAHHHNLVSKHSSNGGSNGHVVKPQHLEHHAKTTTEEKVCKAISVFQVPTNVPVNQNQDSSDVVLLKDKFTNEEGNNVSRFKCLVPIKQGFLFTSMKDASTEVIHEVKKIDIGTNTTPHGSSNALQCPTLFQSVSPPRHNTPASMSSGPLALMNAGSSFDIAELQECHFAKLQLESPFDLADNACNWSSREEEEEDVSKSLRHFEMNNECPKSILEPKVCAWQEEEKTKSQLRYQREEAKIEAWVNLQKAKVEAQSRKLEVKIQKMRFKFEEKMMKSMAKVHRKAEELRAAAQYEHTMQLRKATLPSKKTKDLRESMHFSGRVGSCGCFPCNSTL